MDDPDYDLNLLEKQLEILQGQGFDMSLELQLFHSGGWAEAFAGVHYEHLRNPGLLKQSDIDFLMPIFGYLLPKA